jgi:4-amino-4-deoxy-L-arabinose transferase-like glycosyltransferase
MSRTSARVLIVLVAVAHACLYIVYQSPDWLTEWTDQNGYMLLGQALAETGRFTRYPLYPQFIPEVIRTPGYPLFVAAVYRTLGYGHLPVALAQAGVFAGIALLAYATARLVANDRTAFAVGLVVALYPTLPYFGALTMSELFTTFLVTLGVYLWLRALDDGGGWAAGAGLVLAAAALTRPNFQYLPVALVLFAALMVPPSRVVRRRSAVMLLVFVTAVAPWVIRNVVYFHAVSIAPPAAGIGRTLWEGNWQLAWPGRVQATLTRFAETTWDRSALDEQVLAYAGTVRMDAELMLRYVHEWQDMRRMWDDPQNPPDRAAARAEADRAYRRLAIENIRRHPVRHVWRRMTRGVALLWITEIPIRYSDINRLPTILIRLIWFVQGLVMAAAIAGVYVLWRRDARAQAAAFVALIVYITAVQVVLFSEARFTLPARPVELLLAVIAVQATAFSVTDRGTHARSRGTQAPGSGRPQK